MGKKFKEFAIILAKTNKTKQNKPKIIKQPSNTKTTLHRWIIMLSSGLTITSSLTGMLFSTLKTVIREDVTLMGNSEFGFNFVEYYNRVYLLQYSVAHLSIRKKFKILYPSP